MDRTEWRDPRTAVEQAVDLTDAQLFDFYHECALLFAEAEETFSREAVMNMIRDAYWRGVADRADHPERTVAVARQIRSVLDGLESAAD